MRSVGFDLDGVLYMWHEVVYDYFTAFKGYNGSYNTFWKNYKTILSNDDWKTIVDIAPFYSVKNPPMFCVDFLNAVAKKYTIHYITYRPESAVLSTEKYLSKYNFPFKENLIFTPDKADHARLLKLKYFVEDRIDYIEPLSKVTNVILRAQPWNEEYWDKYPTAHSFSDMAKFMEVEWN